jgi:hypothetical protein
MMFALNVYNQYTGSVKELEIVKTIWNSKRFSDTDEIVIVLPDEFAVEFSQVIMIWKANLGI